jgi:hypothetical protein
MFLAGLMDRLMQEKGLCLADTWGGCKMWGEKSGLLKSKNRFRTVCSNYRHRHPSSPSFHNFQVVYGVQLSHNPERRKSSDCETLNPGSDPEIDKSKVPLSNSSFRPDFDSKLGLSIGR